ncbi:helix-turn-helix domain-containing protein [Vibrio salilacus]|uniref:helix-turn-helix domain-containing protein n=1 Tax=Vibrio salilacus TaxID=1323749 RepID=UPI001FEC79B5|nr:helix-turn-helix domain-containing protein [Vibrio salilacus]
MVNVFYRSLIGKWYCSRYARGTFSGANTKGYLGRVRQADKGKMSRVLGISRNTIYRKLKAIGIG